MSEQSSNKRAPQERKPQGNPISSFGSSPLIAASAAARLVHSILARLDTPHAAPTMRPLSEAVLWKQVARRLGYPTHEPQVSRFPRAESATNHVVVTPAAQQQAVVPPVGLVWRTRPVAQHDGESYPVTAGQPQPAAPARPSFQFVGQPAPVSLSPAPIDRIDSAVPAAPHAESTSGPPKLEPATVIRVEYIPVPLVAQLQPSLPVLQSMSQEATSTPAEGPKVRSLAYEVNRDLVPTTDLLSRMVRTPNAEIIPAQPRPDLKAVAPAAPSTALEAQTLSMPLATPAGRSAEGVPSEVGLPIVSIASRGPLARLMERISTAMPMPDGARRALRRERGLADSIMTPERPAESRSHSAMQQSDATGESSPAQTAQPVVAQHFETVYEQTLPVESTSQIHAQSATTVPPEAEVPLPRTDQSMQGIAGEVSPRQVGRGTGGPLATLLARLLGGEASGASEHRAPLHMPWARPASQRESNGDAVSMAGVAERVIQATPVADAAQTSFASPHQTDVALAPEGQEFSEQPPIAATPQHQAPAADTPAPPLPATPMSALPGPQVLPEVDRSELVAQDESTEIEGVETWRDMSEVASEVAKMHEPIGTVPSGIAPSDSFVGRILRRLGAARADVSAQGSFDKLERAAVSDVGARTTSTSGAIQGGTRVSATWQASTPIAVPAQSQQFTGTPASLPAGGLSGGQPLRLAIGPLEIGRGLGIPITSGVTAFGGVLRSVASMSRSIAYLPPQVNTEEGAGSGMDDYMTTLEQLYGPEEHDAALPLAVPFGAYAAPSERAPYFARGRSSVTSGAEALTGGPLPYRASGDFGEQHAISTSATMPALTSFQAAESAPDGYFSDYSWGDASDDGSFHAEANAWADVVASAVGRGQPAGAPALALAGSERSPESGPQRPPNEDKVASPNLDDLADTVYSLIRERLAIEKERSFA